MCSAFSCLSRAPQRTGIRTAWSSRNRWIRCSKFPHQVDAGIGDRSPDRRIGVAVDIGLHDRQNHRNEGRHDPASIMHLGLAPPFGKGRSTMEDLVPQRVEPVKDDSQYPVNILSRQFPAHARCLPQGLLDERGERDTARAGESLGLWEQFCVDRDRELLLHRRSRALCVRIRHPWGGPSPRPNGSPPRRRADRATPSPPPATRRAPVSSARCSLRPPGR